MGDKTDYIACLNNAVNFILAYNYEKNFTGVSICALHSYM